MIILSKFFLLMLFLPVVFIGTNHQGVAQRIIQAAFVLAAVNVFWYIYNLRR